jgi:hypothetical protein
LVAAWRNDDDGSDALTVASCAEFARRDGHSQIES